MVLHGKHMVGQQRPVVGGAAFGATRRIGLVAAEVKVLRPSERLVQFAYDAIGDCPLWMQSGTVPNCNRGLSPM